MDHQQENKAVQKLDCETMNSSSKLLFRNAKYSIVSIHKPDSFMNYYPFSNCKSRWPRLSLSNKYI